MHLERFQNKKFSYPGEGDTSSPGPFPPRRQGPKGKDTKKEDVGKMIRWKNKDNILQNIMLGGGMAAGKKMKKEGKNHNKVV